MGVASTRRAHILGIERILERENDPVHRHLLEIGIAAISGVKLRRTLERIGQMPEIFAHRRRPLRQRPLRGMQVEIAAACHRAFAANVKRGQRIDLTGVRLADGQPELLLHRRIGRSCFHAPELERRAFVLIEIGQQLRCLDGLCGKFQPCTPAHGSARFGDGRAVLRDQKIGSAVKGAHARKVMPYDIDAGGLTRLDRGMQFVDRCLFGNEGFFRRADRLVHGGASSSRRD